MKQKETLLRRSEVAKEDTWDLRTLFKSDGEWERTFSEWEKSIDGYARFRGKLDESAATLAACFAFDREVDQAAERLGTYAYLKTSEDQGNSEYQRMKGRYQLVASKAAEASAFIRPELMAIDAGSDVGGLEPGVRAAERRGSEVAGDSQ